MQRVAAEDTRHTRSLLQHFGIDKPLVSLHDHNEDQRADQLVAWLAAGESIALVSDAGTPLISDPGFRVVRRVRQAGYRVIPVPGACAAIAALCASGLPTDRFRFVGFLPARSNARTELMRELARSPETLVFYESPRRLIDMLEDLQQVLGADRQVAVAKELTKLHERIFQGSVRDALALFADVSLQRGEFVVLVEGTPEPATAQDAELIRAQEWMRLAADYLPPKQAAALVASLSGADKKTLYRQWTSRHADLANDEDGLA